MNTEQRFWVKVKKGEDNDCWEWLASKDRKGYGKFYSNSTHIRAHRYSFELANGVSPKGLFVCHKCDNPACVNPAHLFLGTNAENVADAVKKGRHFCMRVRKLTIEQAKEVKTLYEQGLSIRKLGKIFGVAYGTIWMLVTHKTYKSQFSKNQVIQ